MNIDDFGQNLNTRVVFKEPRGMSRWLQLLFALIAVLTVTGFETRVGIEINCIATEGNTTTNTTRQEILNVTYPFDFSSQKLSSNCSNAVLEYKHPFSLSGSPQFFIMTGSLSLIFVMVALAIYLIFSSLYQSMPILPVIDMIVTMILALFWFSSALAFAFGVNLMKNTVTYEAIAQTICQSPKPFNATNYELTCKPLLEMEEASWNSLDVALLSGFTSFFLWMSGIWFVFKETHFHTPKEQYTQPN